MSPTACHRCNVSLEFKDVLPRRLDPEMGPAIMRCYTFRRNTMKTTRFDFEKKATTCFLVSYRLSNIAVSCLLECGVMTWAQSDLYGETLSFFLFSNSLKTL